MRLRALLAHWPIALLAAATAAAATLLGGAEVIGAQDDGAVYLMTARHFSLWLPPDPVAAVYALDSPFPPGLPAVLALAGAGTSIQAAHATIAACLALALMALYAWLRALGLGRGVATATAAVFAAAPGTTWLMFNVLSEPLYLALSLAACAGFARGGPLLARADAGVAAVTALVAAALLVRSAGIALLPALALYLWQRLRWRGVPLLLAALLPSLAWSALQSSSLDYGGLLRHAAPHLLQDLPGFLRVQGAALAEGLRQNLFLSDPWHAAPLALLAFAATAWRAARLRPDALALLAYLALILAWPFPAEARRLAWIAVPMLMGHLLWALQQACARWKAAAPSLLPAVPGLVVAALALAVAPAPALVAARWNHPAARAEPGLRHVGSWYAADLGEARVYGPMDLALARAFREFGAQMPPGSCSLSVLPRLVAYYSGRAARLPPPAAHGAAGFEESLRWRACQYLVMVALTNERGPAPFYPLERLGDRVEIVARRGVSLDGHVVPLAVLGRLRPPDR